MTFRGQAQRVEDGSPKQPKSPAKSMKAQSSVVSKSFSGNDQDEKSEPKENLRGLRSFSGATIEPIKKEK